MRNLRNILILLLLIVSETFSQTGDRVQLFSIEEGLSLSAITCVFQDSEGFLWIGTQDGLNRYDGYEFKIFRRQPLDSTSLTDNFIRTIAEDSLGNVWIGTNYGLSKYIRSEGRFENYYHRIGEDNSLYDNTIHDILVSEEGNVWVKTASMLEKYNPDSNNFEQYRLVNDPNTVMQGIHSNIIVENKDGKLWIGTEDGLHFFDPKEITLKQYTHNANDEASLSNNNITSLYFDDNGTLWICTKDGFNRYLPEEDKFERYYPSKNRAAGLIDEVNFITQDHQGVYWVGTARGLGIFNPQTGETGKALNLQVEQRDLTNAYFSDVIEDDAHILWIATYRGLIKMDLKKQKFKLYDNSPSSIPELTSNVIASVYHDNEDNLWIGTWGEGLNMYNRKTGNFRLYSEDSPIPGQRISQNHVHVIFEDDDGKVFIGTVDGIDRYNPRSRTFSNICNIYGFIPCDAFEDNRVYDMIQVGNIYYVATAKGLFSVDLETNSFQHFNGFKGYDEDIQFNTVFSLLFDTKNRLWVGSDNGLLLLNDSLHLQHYYQNRLDSYKGELSSNVIYDLFEDSQNRIWVGTSLGLHQFLEINETFLLYTEEKGLPNNLIYAIVEDNDGNLWISTNRGLSKFDPTNKIFVNYEISDGLQSFEFNIGAHYKKEDGELFFGGISGLNAFYPDSFTINHHIPNIVITSLKKVDKNGVTTIYKSYGENEISIDFPNHILNIQFASLDFTYPEKNQYRYSLNKEGEEENYINLGTHRYLPIMDLQPGRYELSYSGSNNDLVWNTNGGKLIINVEVPWWRTSKAIIFYGLIIAFTLLVLYMYRTRTLRRLNREYKERERINNQIATQREELALKNKNITDSLNYAKRIQEAMMPSKNMFSKFLPDSFILHMPKDIVSGDFYWINEHEDKVYVAAIDCTGHGVPGAFMSIIGFELFRRITNIQGVEEPAQILNIVNNNFAEVFRDVEEFSLRDGMDIAFCVVDKKRKVMEYSGAFNPLYLIRDNKLSEIKGDRFSVGIDMHLTKNQAFRNHSINLEDGDVIYIFSDGFADQFGGPEGKKYKYRRFRHLLLTIHKLPMKMQHDLLRKSILEWKGDLDQVDDILVIGFKP